MMEVQTKIFTLGGLGSFEVRIDGDIYDAILRSNVSSYSIHIDSKFIGDGYQSALKHIAAVLNKEAMQLRDKAQVYSELKDGIDLFIEEN